MSTIIDQCIFDFTGGKNLGRAYNEAMERAPQDSHVILRDGDSCWLTSDYGVHIAEYIRQHPDAVLTCWTNRINEKAEQQYPHMALRESSDMRLHLQQAEEQKRLLYHVSVVSGFVSGFCMIVPKKVWELHKFSEVQPYPDRGPHALLGIDNDFTNRIRATGIQVLRMDGLYIWHTYRLLTGDKDKSHLL